MGWHAIKIYGSVNVKKSVTPSIEKFILILLYLEEFITDEKYFETLNNIIYKYLSFYKRVL